VIVMIFEDPEDAGEGLAMRHVWIAGAVGAVLLVVVLAVTLAVTSGGGDGPDKHAAAGPASTTKVTPSASVPASSAPPVSAAPSTGPAAPSSAPATAPVVRWRGMLTVNGPSVERDLDVVPPRQDIPNADLRGDWLKPLLIGLSGAQVAVVDGRPDAAGCRDAAAATGSDRTDRLQVGDVVCVVTSGNHVARLITTRAEQTSTAPRMSFSVVLWELPGGGQ
jgi:hypothetical protein